MSIKALGDNLVVEVLDYSEMELNDKNVITTTETIKPERQYLYTVGIIDGKYGNKNIIGKIGYIEYLPSYKIPGTDNVYIINKYNLLGFIDE